MASDCLGPSRDEAKAPLRPAHRKVGQQVGESSIGVGNRPILLLLVLAATDDGLDLRHALGGIRKEHDEPSRFPRLDLDGAG